MDTRKRLEQALYDAMRSNNELRKRTIRMALANIKNAEIDQGISLDEAAVLVILQKEVKSRNESINDANKANRTDLIETAEEEKKVIEEFLPRPMDDSALRDLIQEVIIEISAVNPSDMGRVIKLVMGKTQGRTTGEQVSKIVRDLLPK